MSTASKPRILLLEDDPVTRVFLTAAAQAMPAQVDCAGTLAQARALASAHAYDLLLADANLPDGRGSELLGELRRHGALSAIAHTAATARAQLDALADAGFEEVLTKPLTAPQLQQAIRRVLGKQAGAHATQPRRHEGRCQPWDEAAALAAVNGHARQAMQLRALFLAELPAQRDAILAALDHGDAATLQACLHRLRGSCGFVGAVCAGATVRALMEAPESSAARKAFTHAIEDMLSSGDGTSA